MDNNTCILMKIATDVPVMGYIEHVHTAAADYGSTFHSTHD